MKGFLELNLRDPYNFFTKMIAYMLNAILILFQIRWKPLKLICGYKSKCVGTINDILFCYQ